MNSAACTQVRWDPTSPSTEVCSYRGPIDRAVTIGDGRGRDTADLTKGSQWNVLMSKGLVAKDAQRSRASRGIIKRSQA